MFFPFLVILAAYIGGHGSDGEALAGRRSGFRNAYGECGFGSGENRAEVAAGESLKLTEAPGEFLIRQPPFAVQPPQEISSLLFSFL